MDGKIYYFDDTLVESQNNITRDLAKLYFEHTHPFTK